jgi:asparagine synthetase B (glutamine-hydrolysing)
MLSGILFRLAAEHNVKVMLDGQGAGRAVWQYHASTRPGSAVFDPAPWVS